MTRLLYIDLFCGAGGTSTGICKSGMGKVVAAVNHDEQAIASHKENHSHVLHFTEDIRTLDTAPLKQALKSALARHPGAKTVLWASCECTNYSKAKGGQSRDGDSRTLAEHLCRYIRDLRPDYVQVENVEEFLSWGPLVKKRDKITGLPVLKRNSKTGRKDFVWVPDPARKGEWFRLWRRSIMYAWHDRKKLSAPACRCEWRLLNAADFGAATSRTRLFVQFARAGLPISWPSRSCDRESWRPVRHVLDLDDIGESIFTRKKPLCDNTLRRIAEGVRKFASQPRMRCSISWQEEEHINGIQSIHFLTRYFSGNGHNTSIDEPCGTLTTIPHQYPVTVTFMDNYFGNGYPTSIDEPCGTICTKQQRFPVTVVFLTNYYSGGGQLASTESPCPTLTTNPKPRVVCCQFLDQQYGQSGPASIDAPCPTITTNLHHGIVTASYIRAMMRPRTLGLTYPIDAPIQTLLTRDYFYLDTCRYQYTTGRDYSRPVPGDSAAMLDLKRLMRERCIADICMRPITVRESLRIMGFPEDYRLCGTQTQQRKFIGNAVEVNTAAALARATATGVEKYEYEENP